MSCTIHSWGEGNGTPLQWSCLENPRDGGAWWAAVHGVAKSRTRLSVFTFTFHFHALEKEMEAHSSVPAWRIPGTGEPGGLPSVGSQRVGYDWSDFAAAAYIPEWVLLLPQSLELPIAHSSCSINIGITIKMLFFIKKRSFLMSLRYNWQNFKISNIDSGFPGGMVVENLPPRAGDRGDVSLIPGSGRSPGLGNGNPLQYSCLENAMDGGAYRATIHSSGVSHDRATEQAAWFDGLTLFVKIPTVELINIFSTWHTFCVYVWEILSSVMKFQIRITVLSTIVTMLYIRPLDLSLQLKVCTFLATSPYFPILNPWPCHLLTEGWLPCSSTLLEIFSHCPPSPAPHNYFLVSF